MGAQGRGLLGEVRALPFSISINRSPEPIVFEAWQSEYLVHPDERFRIADAPTAPAAKHLAEFDEGSDKKSSKQLKKRLRKLVDKFSDLQRVLYADDRYSLLLIFQAMDAAGKDGTIRAVTRGVNPAGFQVFSFKQPSAGELDHDFLWRTARRLPERGRIGVFNRSYYEEVLVVRVHPEYLRGQRLPSLDDQATQLDELFSARYESIADHERHLARNGTIVLKFWLNVSPREQKRRFLARLQEPTKNWKFSTGDLEEAEHWDAYMDAYEEALAETSKPWAPWYAIPADNKDYMRVAVAEIIVESLKQLDLRFPEVNKNDLAEFADIERRLASELADD